MFPTLFRDPDATTKLLDTIIESPNGRRSMSRLARTCKAMCEPALNVLWRELDSLLPLISLFPNNIMKRARRPGLGLVSLYPVPSILRIVETIIQAKAPNAEDWDRVLAYGERVRRVAYIESSPSVSPSVFAIIAENRPVPYILPHLQTLIWRVETAAGLERSTLFLNPELQSLILEVGTRIPQLGTYLVDVCSQTQLTAFSFTSPTSLPETFTDLVRSQNTLEKLALVAPGALSSQVGQWAASLPALHTLELDLTGRSIIAVEGFFDDIVSGAATPSDASSDSGVFSGDEIDFTEIKKSSLRLTGDLHSGGVFTDLRSLQLTGEVANIAVFLKHITSELTSLELVIEDPPDMADWQDLSVLICERFSRTLLSLRIGATGASRFTELVRATSRAAADQPSRHLPLQYLSSLPALIRLEIDLPESTLFFNEDLRYIAKACPNIETLRLCPMARFSSSSGPNLTLEGVATLTQNCQRLQNLALVLDARPGSVETLCALEVSSRSLLRFHVGHSIVNDPLHTTILLSHLAPHLESLKWFHEKNRPGYVEANAQGWQKVSDWLPHLQGVRLMERAKALGREAKRYTKEQSVDATIKKTYVNKFAHVRPKTVEQGIQSAPTLVDRMVQIKPDLLSVFVDATPTCVETAVDATPEVAHQCIGVGPVMADIEVDATIPPDSLETSFDNTADLFQKCDFHAIPSVLPAILTGLLALACRVFLTYPLTLPKHMLDKSLSMLHAPKKNGDEPSNEKHELHGVPWNSTQSTSELLDHDIPPVCL